MLLGKNGMLGYVSAVERRIRMWIRMCSILVTRTSADCFLNRLCTSIVHALSVWGRYFFRAHVCVHECEPAVVRRSLASLPPAVPPTCRLDPEERRISGCSVCEAEHAYNARAQAVRCVSIVSNSFELDCRGAAALCSEPKFFGRIQEVPGQGYR